MKECSTSKEKICEICELVGIWLNKIDKKHLHAFTIFNIKDFYPSIKEILLKNAIQFAAEHTNINKNGFEVIFHAPVFVVPF